MTIIEVSGIIFLILLFEAFVTAFIYVTGDAENFSIEVIFVLICNIIIITALGADLFKSKKEIKELKATYEVAIESEVREDL